jgi:hypothetical protein
MVRVVWHVHVRWVVELHFFNCRTHSSLRASAWNVAVEKSEGLLKLRRMMGSLEKQPRVQEIALAPILQAPTPAPDPEPDSGIREAILTRVLKNGWGRWPDLFSWLCRFDFRFFGYLNKLLWGSNLIRLSSKESSVKVEGGTCRYRYIHTCAIEAIASEIFHVL